MRWRWPWFRKSAQRQRPSKELIRALAAEIHDFTVASFDQRNPGAAINISPLVLNIMEREGLDLEDLDRLVIAHREIAEAFVPTPQLMQLVTMEPAGRA